MATTLDSAIVSVLAYLQAFSQQDNFWDLKIPQPLSQARRGEQEHSDLMSDRYICAST